MQMSFEEFFDMVGLQQPLLPGERKVIPVRSEKPGASYCIVYDWRSDLEKIRVEIKPGMTGRDLSPERMKDVPPSLKTPIFVEANVDYDTNSITTANDDKIGEEKAKLKARKKSEKKTTKKKKK